MRFRSMIANLLALAAAGLCVQGAFAHHSFAMFDNSRSVVLKGVVQRYQWTNPHGYLELKADDGTRYTLELTSINMLSRAGWTSRSVKFGDRVSALVSPLRNGQPGGLLLELTFADGHTIVNPVPNPQNYTRSR
ncbi:MAG: DUF6152 family protein [Sphingomonadales bacterium]